MEAKSRKAAATTSPVRDLLPASEVTATVRVGPQAPAAKPFWLQDKVVAVAASVAWMTVSSALILVNKYIMSTDGFVYPMTLSGLGIAFSGVASFLCCKVFRLVPAQRSMSLRFYAVRILPIGLFMALTLYFSNIVYLFLTVAFIQMLKAFTPIVVMVAQFAAGLEAPTGRLIASVTLIALGTAVASYGEGAFSWAGLACMFLAEAFEATRLVMTQILLTGLQFHPVEGLMYSAPACLLWLGVGAALLELPAMRQAEAFQKMADKPLLYLCAAAMGFGVNALTYVVIQSSSSLTLKVLGTVKNAAVVWVGIVFLQDVVTGLQGFGYGLSLAAFAWYNHLKLKQADELAKHAKGYIPLAHSAAK